MPSRGFGSIPAAATTNSVTAAYHEATPVAQVCLYPAYRGFLNSDGSGPCRPDQSPDNRRKTQSVFNPSGKMTCG